MGQSINLINILNLLIFLSIIKIIFGSFCSFPKATNTEVRHVEEIVTQDKDFKFVRLVAGSDLGACGIDFSKKMDPILWVKDGVTIKNLILGDPCSSGIYCSGSCTLENV